MSDHVDESFDEFLDDDVDEPARPVRLAPVDVLSDAPAGARERIRLSLIHI